MDVADDAEVGHGETRGLLVLCIGSQICVLTAPGTFQLDEKGQSVVLDADGDAREVVIDGAEGCPVEAITVYDESGERIAP